MAALCYRVQLPNPKIFTCLKYSQQKKFADPIAWAPDYTGLIPKDSHFEDTDKNKNHSVSGLFFNHKGIYHT